MRQWLEITRVAFPSHLGSAAAVCTSTAAKYFGEFGAGFPRGLISPVATRTGISCSAQPITTAASPVVSRPGRRRQDRRASASALLEIDFSVNMTVGAQLSWLSTPRQGITVALNRGAAKHVLLEAEPVRHASVRGTVNMLLSVDE